LKPQNDNENVLMGKTPSEIAAEEEAERELRELASDDEWQPTSDYQAAAMPLVDAETGEPLDISAQFHVAYNHIPRPRKAKKESERG